MEEIIKMIVTMIIIVVVVIIAIIRILWDVYSPLSDPEAFAAALIDDVSHVITTTNNDSNNNNGNNRDGVKSLQSLKKKVANQIRDQCYQIWTQGHLNNNNDVSPSTNNNANNNNNNSNSNSNSNKRPKTANVRYAYGVRKHKKEVQDFTPEFTTNHNINYHQNDEDPLQRT